MFQGFVFTGGDKGLLAYRFSDKGLDPIGSLYSSQNCESNSGNDNTFCLAVEGPDCSYMVSGHHVAQMYNCIPNKINQLDEGKIKLWTFDSFEDNVKPIR